MSILILVRHAQASFGDENYDKLSLHGKRQAGKLAEYWLSQKRSFDRVFAGPATRHQETAKSVQDIFRAAGRSFPGIDVWPGLDENDVDRIVEHYVENGANEYTHIKELATALSQADSNVERQQCFQRLFEAASFLWLEDRWAQSETESWLDFRARVIETIGNLLRSANRGSTIVAFTSVGPITVALQRALQCTDKVAFQTGWRLWNCSLTEFVFSGERFTIDSFNCLPHLPNREEWTYR